MFKMRHRSNQPGALEVDVTVWPQLVLLRLYSPDAFHPAHQGLVTEVGKMSRTEVYTCITDHGEEKEMHVCNKIRKDQAPERKWQKQKQKKIYK